MKLKQDVDVEYAIRNSTRFKRRSAIFSPRKGGGHSNISHVRSDPNKILDIISPRPKNIHSEHIQGNVKKGERRQNMGKKITSLEHAHFDHTRPRSAPSSSDIHRKTENHVRVRNEVKLPATSSLPWDSSTCCLDREFLQIQQDNKISAYRESHCASTVRPQSSHCKKGGSHETDRRTLTASFSRCRASKTSGPVVNIRPSRHDVGENVDAGIHSTRWNIATKEKDEEERAKPSTAANKSTEFLLSEFHSNDRRRHKCAGMILDSNILVPDEAWEFRPQKVAPRRVFPNGTNCI